MVLEPFGGIVRRPLVFLCLIAALGGAAYAQPQITSLQSADFFGSDFTLGPAITGGSPLEGGFVVIINGTFNPNNFSKVTWSNPATGDKQDFLVGNGVVTTGTTQIVIQVPTSLIPTVSSAQPVNITVTEVAGSVTQTSAPAVFTINPPATAPALLPAGTVNVAYSGSLFSGGTPPYQVFLQEGSTLPPGLSLPTSSTSTLLTGTPTQTGQFSFGITVTDAWDNFFFLDELIEIVPTPTITQVSPNSTIAGTNGVAITVTGTNFVAASNFDSLTNYPSSIITLTPSGGTASASVIQLPTTLVNATTAQATIPAQYLSAAQVYSVQILQPSGTASNGLPFTVLAPAITLVTPSTVTARTTAIPIVVTGSSFLASGFGSPVQSTILLNGSAVATTFNNSGSLSTSAVLNTPSTVTVQVMNPGGSRSNSAGIVVLAPPTITSVTNPFGGGGLTVLGTNFTNTTVILFNGSPLSTSFTNSTRLSAIVPNGLFASAGASALVSVQTADNYVTPAVRISLSGLQITTASLPNASGLQPYTVTLTGIGGISPYLWSASGLPVGLSLNSSTGQISGTPTTFGTFQVLVGLTDSTQATVTVRLPLNVSTPVPPPQLTPGALPTGFVNVSYTATIAATGGNGTLTFSQGNGNFPPGLDLQTNGLLRGLPTTAGNYTFSITVSDSAGLSSTGSFTLVIKPQPLAIITSSPLPTVPVGGTINVTFTAFGGVQPYSFSGTNLPPGANLATNGTMSGTATTAGTFNFSVTVSDNAGDAPSTKNFSLTVTAPLLTIVGTLGDGQVGIPYTGQISVSGGTSPYTVTVTGLPDGLAYNNGAVTGTPTTTGKFTVTVNATDAKGVTASQQFTVNITTPPLSITTASLANGTVGVNYSATLAATGGVAPYTWSVGGLPSGVSGTSAGAISGVPTAAGSFSVSATVTDSKGVTASKTYSITVSLAPLTITTTTLGNATAGVAYSDSVSAAGGVQPYTFTASGLPSGLSMSSSGAITGTTTAAGSASVSVTVKDAAGTTASKSYSLLVALPPPPAFTVTGLPSTSAPASQSSIQIGLGAPYPVSVTVTLTLTFAPDSGSDDPTVQFATGGRTTEVTIPAGSTSASAAVGIQTGTVSGTVTITARLAAGAQDVTPSPVPTRTIRINSVAPVISSVTATATSTGFTVTITGFATGRRMTQAIFTFTPAAGVNLQTTSVTIPADALFSTWYSSTASVQFGSQFIYTQPFTVNGGSGAITSVTVTLVNADGSSSPVTATVK